MHRALVIKHMLASDQAGSTADQPEVNVDR